MPRTNLSDSLASVADIAGKGKIIERNTFRYTRASDGAEVTRLHTTDIVVKFKDGRVQLNSGGWQSKTTKDRMGYSGYYITQNKGAWTVHDRSPYGPGSEGVRSVPYYDGMILPDAFEGAAKAKGLQVAGEQIALDIQIGKFVKLIGKNGAPIPKPASGDCYYCQMPDKVKYMKRDEKTGKLVEDEAPNDTGHLLEHIREGYMHGSLILNALRFCGYQDAGIAFWTGWGGGGGSPAKVRRDVKKYLRIKLGLPY